MMHLNINPLDDKELSVQNETISSLFNIFLERLGFDKEGVDKCRGNGILLAYKIR